MTHPPGKRLPRPGHGKVVAAVAGLVAALGLGALGEAHAAPPAAGAGTPAAPSRWSDHPHGFASLAGGTTGGAGGEVVTVTDQAALAKYAAAPGPYVIRVAGSITAQPFGASVEVASDKTIVGVGTTGELVQGEFHLSPGTHNVIIRNLTIRDSAVEGDWDCKGTDFDGIQMDTVHHVWIDHNRFSRICDGQLDIRKNSEYVTVSHNRFEDNNKTFGVGWTADVRTQITVDHNWFRGTKQRNPSVDNAAYAHLYNNYLTAQADPGDPVWTYGNWSRGGTRMVIENSYYEDVQHPYQADATAELVQRGSVLKNTSGRHDTRGAAFDPRDFYAYRLDPARAVPALVRRFSGPQQGIGVVRGGDDGPVTTAVAPGTCRAGGHRPANEPKIVPQGTGQDRSGTVIVYGTPAAHGGSNGGATVRNSAGDATARDLPFGNGSDGAAHEPDGGQAPATRSAGDRTVPEDTASAGGQDTLTTDSPEPVTVVEGPVISALGSRPATGIGCGPAAPAGQGVRDLEPPAATRASPPARMGGFPRQDAPHARH
ncbi:right-handed parallel beta-helix repeat-containing protein [Streptomyces sp. JB150]|uniref:pectate lyase family protein n=1 Tax=Streptomyces sp. JB150 TaxID=2714844 RepID=UPI00140EC42B|nr:right-handed parallel beta-helix repeat-containing protein [Streptomyces sp. JB150]QIJ61974.1 pectate lyase [Streptomyces sp. JB150]